LSKIATEFRANVNIGDDLSPDRAYLDSRIDLWERACLLIGAELWKQLAPNDPERAGTLTNIAYKHLLGGRWKIAEAISDFTLRDRQMPESVITSAQLNYWQARKRCGEWDAVNDEVDRADYSAKSDLYQLARLALLERNDEFFALLPRALQSGAVSKQELEEWPIFSDARKDSRYADFAPPQKKRRRGTPKARTKKSPRDDT
jgi:hypothetical protein